MLTEREKFLVAIGAAYAMDLVKESGWDAAQEFLSKDKDDETINEFAENLVDSMEVMNEE